MGEGGYPLLLPKWDRKTGKSGLGLPPKPHKYQGRNLRIHGEH